MASESADIRAEEPEEIEVITALGSRLISAILEREPFQNVEALVDAGAPLWYQEQGEGISPLHAAAYVENKMVVKFLINQGAVWNAGE